MRGGRDVNEYYVIFRQAVCVKNKHRRKKFQRQRFLLVRMTRNLNCNSLGSSLSFSINEQHFVAARLSISATSPNSHKHRLEDRSSSVKDTSISFKTRRNLFSIRKIVYIANRATFPTESGRFTSDPYPIRETPFRSRRIRNKGGVEAA